MALLLRRSTLVSSTLRRSFSVSRVCTTNKAEVFKFNERWNELNEVQQHFVAKHERQNVKDHELGRSKLRSQRKVVGFLFVCVIVIYFLTLRKVGSDDFLKQRPPSDFVRTEDSIRKATTDGR